MKKKPNQANQLVKRAHSVPVPQVATPSEKPQGPKLLTDAPEDLSDEDRQKLEFIKQQATFMLELSGGIYLADIAKESFGRKIDICGFQYYRDEVFRMAGNPNDPIERMLIDQTAFAHHTIAGLYIKASKAATVEQAGVYYAAAARLLSELRRLALALREYRAPIIRQPQTVVKQQNLAAGDQQIAYLDNAKDSDSAEKIPDRNELDNNDKKAIEYEQVAEFLHRV
jgi:hypothetical protein